MLRSFAVVLILLIVTVGTAQAQLFPTTFPSPSPETAAPVADLSAFVGAWWRHGFSLTVSPDGSAEASWRTYHWCGDPGVTTACDTRPENGFLNGGHAVILFESADIPAAQREWRPAVFTSRTLAFVAVQSPIAHGRVIFTTEPLRIRLGPVDLALLPYDTGALAQDGDGALVCRPEPFDGVAIDDMTPAQRDRWEHRACGA
jgi:hypothetical protein